MLVTLLSAFVKDTVSVGRNQAFFASPEQGRRARIKEHLGEFYPAALQDYLAKISAEDFMSDIESLLPTLTSKHRPGDQLVISPRRSHVSKIRLETEAGALSPETASDLQSFFQTLVQPDDADIPPNQLLLAIYQVLTQEVASAIDQQQAWKSQPESQAAQVLQQCIASNQTTQLSREIQVFIQSQQGISSPTVQSPIEITAAQKQEMRAQLQRQYPGSFPIFELEPSLAGGLRIFHQGALLDQSWITQIANLFA